MITLKQFERFCKLHNEGKITEEELRKKVGGYLVIGELNNAGKDFYHDSVFTLTTPTDSKKEKAGKSRKNHKELMHQA